MPYKLVYFYVRGRGQALRYMTADNDIPMEEEDIKFGDWPAYKPKTTFGQLPILHDGDFEIAQSNAILRHVARKHGLYGQNDKEKAQIDMLNDQQEDVRLTYVKLIYQQYDTEKDNYIASIPDKLAVFEKFLGKNNGGKGFFVGNHISFVDYTMFDLLDNLLILAPHCMDTKAPLLKGFHDRMAARDKLHKLRSDDHFKNMPVNGNGKQ